MRIYPFDTKYSFPMTGDFRFWQKAMQNPKVMAAMSEIQVRSKSFHEATTFTPGRKVRGLSLGSVTRARRPSTRRTRRSAASSPSSGSSYDQAPAARAAPRGAWAEGAGAARRGVVCR